MTSIDMEYFENGLLLKQIKIELKEKTLNIQDALKMLTKEVEYLDTRPELVWSKCEILKILNTFELKSYISEIDQEQFDRLAKKIFSDYMDYLLDKKEFVLACTFFIDTKLYQNITERRK